MKRLTREQIVEAWRKYEAAGEAAALAEWREAAARVAADAAAAEAAAWRRVKLHSSPSVTEDGEEWRAARHLAVTAGREARRWQAVADRR